MRAFKAAVLVIAATGISLAEVPAVTLLEDQQLSFGLIGMIPSETSGQISVDLAGITTVSGAIFSATSAQFGTYTATGLPTLTAVTLSASQLSALSNPGGPGGTTLSLGDFLFPDPAITNNAGDLTFDMGATLSTDGTITDYASGSYDGSILITLIVP